MAIPERNWIDFTSIAKRIIAAARGPSATDVEAEMRRVGLVYIIELTRPANNTMSQAHRISILTRLRKAVQRAISAHPLGVGLMAALRVGRPRAPLFEVRPLAPALTVIPAANAEMARFLILQIPGFSFSDLESILSHSGKNAYDFGYQLRDDLNDQMRRRAGVRVIARMHPDKPFISITCHKQPLGPLQLPYDWPICEMKLKDSGTCRTPDLGYGEGAWTISKTGDAGYGDGIRIGHLDTGYSDHQALRGPRLRWQEGDDPADGKADATDPLVTTIFNSEPGHGTSTATLIASASAANPELPVDSEGVMGAAPRALIVPIRVCDSTAFIWNFKVADGLGAAIVRKCHIVSMSIGGGFTPGFEDLANEANKQNMLLVAAAGNCVYDVVFPARYEQVLAVGASCKDSTYWSHAPDHSKVGIATPGDNVRTTVIYPRVPIPSPIPNVQIPINVYYYNWGSGTSYSTGFTSGVAALWLAFHGKTKIGNVPPGELGGIFNEAVRNSAWKPSGWDSKHHGAGILDAKALLAQPLPVTRPRLGARRQRAARSASVNTARSLLTFLSESVYRERGHEDAMLSTARVWFSASDDAGALSRIDEFGGEMVNLLLEKNDVIYRSVSFNPFNITTAQFQDFFVAHGSAALRRALKPLKPERRKQLR